MPTLMKDELCAAQLVRTFGVRAPMAERDIGECLAVADRIDRPDPGVWYEQWFGLAERVEAAAIASADNGQALSARNGFLRASNYHRTAGVFLLAAPLDDRVRESHRREVATFRRAAASLPIAPEIVEIPYGDASLPAYFFRAGDDGRPRPTVLLTTGYDGSAEELYLANGAAALARGYNVLTFDGPGQGTMLIDRGTPFRPDWGRTSSPRSSTGCSPTPPWTPPG